MRTTIGIVGSSREARLRLMKLLGSKLESEGYSIIMISQDGDNTSANNSSTLTVYTSSSSTFIKANFKLTIDDLKKLFPNRWCLVLIEGYKATPYIVAATSESDVNELVQQSLAVVPLSDSLTTSTTPWRDKFMTVDQVIEVVRRVMIEDIMKQLVQEDCGECGFSSCRDLAEAVAKGEETLLKCVKRREKVKLMVDGEDVPLNPFTSKMFSQVLISLVSILKRVPRNFKKVTVELSLD